MLVFQTRQRMLLFGVLLLLPAQLAHADEPWQAGFSRVDVTPTEPVRMAGYGSRDHASEGIDTPLHVRCFALQSTSSDQASLLISVDTIGLPGSLTRELAEQIKQQHGTLRENIVFCSTHTHAGPDLVSELSNIFAVPLTDDEVAAGNRYKQQLKAGILQAVEDALADLQPAKLSYAVGETKFAANRRVLTDGRWSGFGVQPDGPVDHTVPVLRITGADDRIRGIVFNYACHCTTLGGRHYNINAEWAGYASTDLEGKHPGAVALCTIGCGADANPEPRGTLDATKIHGRVLAAEVGRLVSDSMRPIDAPLDSRFDYAGLSFDLPTQEELQQRTTGTNPQAKRHAEQLLEVLRQHHRLPATYPVPIQSWQFGDQLTMIFLGGEVVVDYALRLKRQLDDPDLWVTAYANDVLGYIASERMRSEGGYEYDRSGVYYGLPGPWATGTEDLLIRRIEELLTSRGRSRPLATRDAIDSLQLNERFQLELVAAEPLVQDPINIAFDAQGRLWVVEMADYPERENGGRVKTLIDEDGDGRFEKSVEFLADLPYPTGVLPWRDGVLISAAPDILFARDTDGDGKADQVDKLYTGFRLANPQHRINGFTYGLDHSLHLASGDNLGELTSVTTGAKVNASGHDVQIWPDSGRIDVTSGRTQYVRSRNDWGEWFGNDNSRPMYHFPIEEWYLERNGAVSYGGNTQQLFSPPVAPPIFAVTSATERFNDLFAANRFTSACSAIVARTPDFALGDEDVAIICEPVHNLVHRAVLDRVGATYAASRTDEETEREFLASSDPWFRPVRAMIGPDGMLYIVDMYRETIEHPEWIPDSWQAQLDLYAGSDYGRVYRISPRQGSKPQPLALGELSTEQLVEQLKSPIGPRRDLAQQLIIERGDASATTLLNSLASNADHPKGRIHALSILDQQGQLQTKTLLDALQDSDLGVLMVALRIAESRLRSEPTLLEPLATTAAHDDGRVVLRTALALGETDDPRAGEILASIAQRGQLDRWTSRAVVSSSKHHAEKILAVLLDGSTDSLTGIPSELLTDLLITAAAGGVDITSRYSNVFADSEADLSAQLRLAASFTAALRANRSSTDGIKQLLLPLYARAVATLGDSEADQKLQREALQLVGIGIESAKAEQAVLFDLISVNTPAAIQLDAIDQLSRFSDAQVGQSLIARWPSMSKTVRDHCVSKMLQRRSWTEQLLTSLESGAVRVADLTAASRQQLAHTGSRSMRVRAERVTRTGGTIEKQQLIGSYLSELSGEPDLVNGAALFKKHCAVCHVANADGQAVGASLDNLSDRSEAALLTAILDPNRAVDPKFQSYQVLTEDDRVLVGAIESEVGGSITLAHADGKRSTVRRDEIVELKNSGISLMPEGFEEIMKPAQMRDLIGHLQANVKSEAR